jgi:hypothetical protein
MNNPINLPRRRYGSLIATGAPLQSPFLLVLRRYFFGRFRFDVDITVDLLPLFRILLFTKIDTNKWHKLHILGAETDCLTNKSQHTNARMYLHYHNICIRI